MKKLLIILAGFAMISCNNGKKPFERRIDKVFGGPVFRNLTIGDSYNKVLKTENENYLQFPDTSMIKYMYHVSDSEEYQWVYIFNNDKVKEIQFDAYLGEESDGAKFLSLVKKKYDKSLGSATESEGVVRWKKDGVSLDLINESPVVLMGKVKIFIYPTGDTIYNRTIPGLD